MISKKSIDAVGKLKTGAVVRFQILDFKTEVPNLMAADCQALRAAGQRVDSHGTNMSAEVWVINTNWSPAVERILQSSTLSYKLLTRPV